jgi:hypothetical protein
MDGLIALALIDGVPTDPKKWGPITWRIIHYNAIDVKEAAEIPYFIKMLRNICAHITCPTCKKHAAMFLAEHPPESYIGSVASNCFKYTVDFHNHVNKITGISTITYEAAYKIWSESTVKVACVEGTPGCGAMPKPAPRLTPLPHPAPQVTMIHELSPYKPIIGIHDLINIPKSKRSRPPEEIRIPNFDEDIPKIKIITKR